LHLVRVQSICNFLWNPRAKTWVLNVARTIAISAVSSGPGWAEGEPNHRPTELGAVAAKGLAVLIDFSALMPPHHEQHGVVFMNEICTKFC
jgi:hypothetical protein